MNLKYQAYAVEDRGRSLRVIDDSSLMEWARDNDVPLWRAPAEALRNDIVPLRYLRNFQVLTFAEQTRICESRVLVCGCGGLGGILVELLSRAGVGRMRLIDGDIFFPTNLNRQLLSKTTNMSRPKVHVAEERVREVNPFIEVEAHSEPLNKENVEDLLQDTDLALDALDNLPARFVLADTARRMGIPFIHAGVAGWWGQISTFPPGSSLDLHCVYGDLRGRDPEEEAVGVLGPTAAVVGSLEAMEAVRLLSGRQPVYADRLMYFDGERGKTDIIALNSRS